MKRSTLALVFVGFSTLGMAGLTQPARSGDRQTAEDQHTQPGHQQAARQRAVGIQINPQALRDRLNRSILHAQQIIDRNTAAIEKLDMGAAPSEVLSELRLQGIARLTTRRETQPQGQLQDQPQGALEGRPAQGGALKSRGTRPNGGRAQGRPMVEPQAVNLFLEQNFPELWKNIEQIRKGDARSAERLLGRMRPQIHEILLLTKSQPDLAKIKLREMQIGLEFVEASRTYRRMLNAKGVDERRKEAALENVRRLAGERFDAQLRSKLFEVQRLEVRLNELKASVEDIESNRDVEVDRMIKASTKRAKRPAKRKPS